MTRSMHIEIAVAAGANERWHALAVRQRIIGEDDLIDVVMVEQIVRRRFA